METILNEDFAYALSSELVGVLLNKFGAAISNAEWTSLFARIVRADRVSLDYYWSVMVRDEIAWCAKVLNILHPHNARHVDLIFDDFAREDGHTEDPNQLGEMILGIWNARITDVRKKFATTRTVVLIKGEDLSTVSVFEEEALKYLPEDYEWEWNQRGNLEGYLKGTDVKKFTWQPHGSQFTITTKVPDNRLKLRIKRPPAFSRDEVLTQLKFDPSWIEIVK